MSYKLKQLLTKQKVVLSVPYMLFIMALPAALAIVGCLLLTRVGLVIVGGAIVVAALLLAFVLLQLVFTCIDSSELKARDLRSKMMIAVKSNPTLPPLVQQALLQVSRKRGSLMTYVGAQRDHELNAMVTRIIDGNFSSLEQINQALSPFDIQVSGSLYTLALFHTLEIPEDAFDLDVENDLRTFGYPNQLAAFFRTIISEMFAADYSCIVCETNGVFRCIVSGDRDKSAEEMTADVKNTSSDIVDIFKKYLSITMLGAVSQSQTDYGNILQSCEELRQLMECRSFIGDTRKILTYMDLTGYRADSRNYLQRITCRQKLLDDLSGRRFDEARELCGQIVRQCENETDMDYSFSKYILSDMAYACLFNSALLPAEVINQQHQKLLKIRTVGEYEGFFNAVIEAAEELSKSKNDSAKWVREMAEYIEANYMDADLTVSWVSEWFHYNPIYASKVFKQITGQNISDYIQGQRLKRSREMLGHGYTVKEIAESCGFGSAAAMTRIYNKTYGVSPGKLNR